MTLNIAKKIAALQRMTVKELRQKHVEVFGQGYTWGEHHVPALCFSFRKRRPAEAVG